MIMSKFRYVQEYPCNDMILNTMGQIVCNIMKQL